ncbi:hypothetical protein V3C33_14880 [Micrococcaceae bacterium Sec5.7]
MRKRALLPAALLLALAGCSGGGSGAAEPGQSAPTSSKSSAAPSSEAPAPGTSEPTDVSSSLNAIGDLQKHTCTAAADGSWTFKGTLVNGSTESRTYTVAVAVTVGAAVQGHTIITETVPAGKSADVTAEKFAKSTGQNGTCEPVVSVEGK